jgi:hypothetical protein
MENSMPDFLADVPLIICRELHFIHDGAPAHFRFFARRYLNRKFPGQWTGRGGPIAWPPRSPDLNTLDFFLWGHLKSLMYLSPVDDVETLQNQIVAGFQTIYNIPGIWGSLQMAMTHQDEAGIQAGGGHMEHLL